MAEYEPSPQEKEQRRRRQRSTLRSLAWGLSIFSQLGISIALPLVACIGGAFWLKERFGLGAWVLLLGIVLGIGTAADCAVKFYSQVMRRLKKQQDEREDER